MRLDRTAVIFAATFGVVSAALTLLGEYDDVWDVARVRCSLALPCFRTLGPWRSRFSTTD